MILLSSALLLRVLAPLDGLPHGVTGCLPPDVLPSPPPCGWSTGFFATPRVSGRLPSQRLRPALARFWFWLSGFDTAPIVAMHSERLQRCQPELRRTNTIPRPRPTTRSEERRGRQERLIEGRTQWYGCHLKTK